MSLGQLANTNDGTDNDTGNRNGNGNGTDANPDNDTNANRAGDVDAYPHEDTNDRRASDNDANRTGDTDANPHDGTNVNPGEGTDGDRDDGANDGANANADGDGDGECVHLMRAAWCALCKPPQAGVLRRGFRTAVGTVYHNDHRCDWLRRGQWKAQRRGRRLTAVVPVAWADVVPGELAPCEYCCSPDWLRRRRR